MSKIQKLKKDPLSNKDEMIDPLSFVSKNKNTIISAQSENKPPISPNKTKKFNLFDDEDEKPKKDMNQDLFHLPKKNTKILNFLDENEDDEKLFSISKKNKDTKLKDEKVRINIIPIKNFL